MPSTSRTTWIVREEAATVNDYAGTQGLGFGFRKLGRHVLVEELFQGIALQAGNNRARILNRDVHNPGHRPTAISTNGVVPFSVFSFRLALGGFGARRPARQVS